jgi:ubiquitin
MDRMKPYQYLYNVFMYRTELAFAKSKGKISVLDTSRIPDGWDMDKWMYYAEILGWAIEDPFKEGNKGAATGKLAGQMNQNSKVLDLEMGSYIQQHIMMLGFIKQELGEIAGVNSQREGQIENRETVGGVERAVTQSSHITEKWFMMHDNTKLRVLETLLETAKYAWRNKSHEKLQYISDEMASVITEIDGQQFNDADYGIMISNSATDSQLIDTMKQLAQAGLQNDKLNFSGLMDIYLSDSMSSIRRKIETYEEETIKQQQAQQEQALQVQQQAIQAQTQSADQDRQQDMQKSILENETKLTLKEMELANNNGEEALVKGRATIEKLKQEWEEMNKKYSLEDKKHSETVRHNKATEVIDKKKAMQKPVKAAN